MSPLPRGDPERTRTTASWYARYSTIGLEFAITLGVFVYGGYWFDAWLGTQPGGIIAGTLLGFVAATLWLERQVRVRARDERDAAAGSSREDRDAGSPPAGRNGADS